MSDRLPQRPSASARPNPALLPSALRLFVANGVWHCETQAPEAAVSAMLSLFGTATVPMVYLASMSAGDVAARIRSLNPQATVTVDTRQQQIDALRATINELEQDVSLKQCYTGLTQREREARRQELAQCYRELNALEGAGQ
jgi:hypothetical protein